MMPSLMLLLCLQAVDRHIVDLANDDPSVRDGAAAALVKEGVRAAPALLRSMEDGDVDVSARATATLRRIGLPAVPVLDTSSSKASRDLAARIVADRAAGYLKDGSTHEARWRDPAGWKHPVLLEAGTGSGHGSTLSWYRFRPGGESVEVVQVGYSGSRTPYETPWPPDEAPVTARAGTMSLQDYALLLRVLQVLAAAEIVEKSSRSYSFSTADFYSQFSVSGPDRILHQDEYAGYRSSSDAPHYARVRAATDLIEDALKAVVLAELPADRIDRVWVTDRFLRDWDRLSRNKSSCWWVQERLLVIVGRLGDGRSLPRLAAIIRDGDAKDRKVYYAINAATRLLGRDVRTHPPEEMKIDANCDRLLPLLEKP